MNTSTECEETEAETQCCRTITDQLTAAAAASELFHYRRAEYEERLVPAVSGVLPADMTAAVTAGGGTAEEETHTHTLLEQIV